MNNKDFYINVGPLNSLYSLYYHLGSELPKLRNSVARGESPNVVFDFKNIVYEKINLLTLIAFLSVSRRIKETIGSPITLLLRWDPNVSGFLIDIGFFHISRSLNIFLWDEEFAGGFTNKTNPMSKILYFDDVQNLNPNDFEAILACKNVLKQKIAPNFILRSNSILKGFSSKTINTIANTTIELIVNSLIHAGDVAFVGLQRSSKRISISVADSGIGFRNSIGKYDKHFRGADFTNFKALVYGSIIQRQQHGLKLAIGELLKGYENLDQMGSDNWILLSSYDTEIKWQVNSWDPITQYFNSSELDMVKLNEICNFLETTFDNQFLRIYPNHLVGSRITFEIPIT